MSDGILGIQKLTVNHDVNEVTTIELRLVAYPGYDANHLWKESWDKLFPGKVIIKCKHCGQWGIINMECKYCGAPVE